MITFEHLTSFVSNPYFLLSVVFLSLTCKFIILLVSARFYFKKVSQRYLLLFLILFLTGAMLDDLFQITYLIVRRVFEIKGYIPNYTLVFRLDWFFFTTQYQALALFLHSLIEKKVKITIVKIIHGLINLTVSGAFLYLVFFAYDIPQTDPKTLFYEIKLIQFSYIYLAFLFIPLFFKILRKMNAPTTPKILANQLRYLTNFFIPYLFLETINNPNSYLAFIIPLFSIHYYIFFTLSSLLCTYAMVYVSKSVMGLRFLNLQQAVASKEKFNFLSQFKDILEQLSYATALKELGHLSQRFFQVAFGITLGRTKLYIRKAHSVDIDATAQDPLNNISTSVEQFLRSHTNEKALEILSQSKIFVYDDIDFSDFYEAETTNKKILTFLHEINADIFLPIYERNTITAYIIVERNSRPQRLFTSKERDEMLVFTSYLSNIINILKYSNIEALHQRQKEMAEELYQKHQENNQYKESIRSFMRSHKDRKIGVVFYKHRRFTLANDAAQELIRMDLNTALGHPLTQAFKDVARKVAQYRTAQTLFAQDHNGNKIVISGIPGLEDHVTILHVYYPEVSDLLKSQLEQLKDPSLWDYVLYLETTQTGRIINQLIPGTGQKLLNFKINLLSTALSKKATLLDMPEKDLLPFVEILHTISLRQALHVLKLTSPEIEGECAIKIFGLNPMLSKDAPDALLEKLDNVGTLFIQNIEHLSLETQNYVAEFIAFGYFHTFKSDHKTFSNVRIICSSTKDLAALTHEGKFSKTLLNELQKMSLKMPSFHSLSEAEIDNLAQGFVEQMTTKQTFKNLLALTDKDKVKLINERPLSLFEFKEKIEELVTHKTSKHRIQEISQADPAFNDPNPEIAQAIRLGKKALKDPHAMKILWEKFKNQNKIATLLGVNRSSVNRRCQEFGLKELQ